MTRTRTLTIAIALIIVGPVFAAGCVSSPTTTKLSSPFIGWSSTGEVGQEATISACSAAGGPITVTILDRVDDAGSSLSAAATISLGGQPFDGSPRLTAVGDSWTSLPLPAASCFTVHLDDHVVVGHVPSKFRFRIDW